MRNDERLRTIYEVMAPYIVRNEHNWRDYLAFASQFHKHSFDNILLVYAQDEDVSILATRKQWATIGRNLIPRAKGVAVCVYRNAKLTLDYLFDVSQTMRGTSPHGNKSLLFPFQTPCRTESSKTIAPVYICLQIKLYNFSKTWSRTQKSLKIWRGFGAMDRLLC